MISQRQIKAARALLDWNQSQLAQKVGLHLNAVNNIERGKTTPRPATLQKIKTAFEMGGVKFRGLRGVEVREESFEVYRFEGPDFIRKLANDILSVVKGPHDEVLNLIPDEELFNVADRKENEKYYRYMKATGFKERILTAKQHDQFINPNKKAYRWLPENILGTMAYNLYGDRVSFISWQTQEVLSIRSKMLATGFAAQYEFLWQQAKPFSG